MSELKTENTPIPGRQTIVTYLAEDWFHARAETSDEFGSPGITTRSWLAGLAMQGIISNGKFMDNLMTVSRLADKDSAHSLHNLVAKEAFAFADAVGDRIDVPGMVETSE